MSAGRNWWAKNRRRALKYPAATRKHTLLVGVRKPAIASLSATDTAKNRLRSAPVNRGAVSKASCSRVLKIFIRAMGQAHAIDGAGVIYTENARLSDKGKSTQRLDMAMTRVVGSACFAGFHRRAGPWRGRRPPRRTGRSL